MIWEHPLLRRRIMQFRPISLIVLIATCSVGFFLIGQWLRSPPVHIASPAETKAIQAALVQRRDLLSRQDGRRSTGRILRELLPWETSHPWARAKVREAPPYGQRASCEVLRAGLLSVLHGLGGDCDGTFGAEFEPVLEVLLLLGNDGCGHLTLLGLGGIHEFHVIPNSNNLSQAIKIS
jgi:hypothetical protein